MQHGGPLGSGLKNAKLGNLEKFDNDFGNQLIVSVKHILKVRICCLSLTLTINKESLGFGLLVGQKKQSEDVPLSSGKLQ